MARRLPLPLRFTLAQMAVLLFGSLAPQHACAQQPAPTSETRFVSPSVADRYIVVFRGHPAMQEAEARMRRYSPLSVTAHPHLGTAAVTGTAKMMRAIATDPEVAQVVPDHVVYAHRLMRAASAPDHGQGTAIVIRPNRPVRLSGGALSGAGSNSAAPSSTSVPPVSTPPVISPQATDTYYQNSPQGWAVRAAGGYGSGVLGGTVAGPWNHTLGTGVRIAVLDSGVDRNHPDIAPNLALNLSEVDPSAQASPCDDGSPQDQEGHGTWVASLAAGAMGANTGRVVGVAPAAALLNIKVLQRMPGTGATLAAQCAAGQASGLVSWLLKGIDDAVAQHADVIVLSLGSIVDLYTGDGAGLKSAFDQVTHAAANAGVLIVAAAGNDGFDLSQARYLELPAQARDVLAVTSSTNPDCAENNLAGATCAAGVATMPYYSNYGAPLQAVAAPGGNYPEGADEGVSGWIRGACSTGKPNTTDGLPGDGSHSYGCFNLGHAAYVQAMGTSASAGLAGGAAALLRSAHPGWTPAQVVASMRSGSRKLQDGSVVLNTASALNVLP